MSKNQLKKNEELRKGGHLMSNNGQWMAVLRDDGNFVIYSKPVWESGTAGSGAVRLVLQADSNLVLYDDGGTPKWHADVNNDNYDFDYHLELTNDGRLVLYWGAAEKWSSRRK